MRSVSILALGLAALLCTTAARAERILYYTDVDSKMLTGDVIPWAFNPGDELTAYNGKYVDYNGPVTYGGKVKNEQAFINAIDASMQPGGTKVDLVIVSLQNEYPAGTLSQNPFANVLDAVTRYLGQEKTSKPRVLYSDTTFNNNYQNENAARLGVSYGSDRLASNVVNVNPAYVGIAYELTNPVDVPYPVGRTDLHSYNIVTPTEPSSVVATYDDEGLPAIVLSEVGNGLVLVNGFTNVINGDSDDQARGLQLHKNEIDFLLGRSVPEPSTIAGLVGMGLIGLAMLRRRKTAR